MNRFVLIPFVLVILIYSSCTKHQDTGRKPPGSDSSTISISDSNYYSFLLDSVAYGAIAFVNDYSTGTFGGTDFYGAAIVPPGVGIFSGYSILDTTEFDEVIADSSASGTGAAFYDSLRPRNFQYGAPGKGVVVEWVDQQGVLWSSMLGSADQSGSSFTITASSHDSAISVIINVSASFNCKLYDSAGDMKLLTNGHSRLGFLGPP